MNSQNLTPTPVLPGLPPLSVRRRRRLHRGTWRAKLARLLRKAADWLCPLEERA
jgi:hypothetical protein